MSETMTNKRDSGIELLRILMMLQIVFLHVADYGGYHNNAIAWGGKQELLFWVVWLLCRCPVYMFIVVMGYFMCCQSTRKELPVAGPVGNSQNKGSGRFLKVYLPMYFYAVLIPIIVQCTGILELDKYDYYQAFLPALSKTWYFMTLYLILLILMPYMNKLIQAMDRREFLILLGIFFFIFSIWQPLAKIDPYNKVFHITKIISTDGGKSLYDFVFMYFLGAFLRKYRFITRKDGAKEIGNWFNLAAFIALGLINTACVYIFPEARTVIGYNDNPLCVIQCVLLLRFFSNLHFYSKVINGISACNLGIYMIHEHPLLRTIIWDRIVKMNSLDFYKENTYILKIIAIIFAIYSICMLIEWIRQKLFLVPGMLLRLKKQGSTKDD